MTDKVQEIRKELGLVQQGYTANEASLIVDHQKEIEAVKSAKPDLRLYLSLIAVIIVIVILMFISVPTITNLNLAAKHKHDICDAWVDKSGREYFVYKQNPKDGIFVGTGPYGRFTVQVDDDYVYSSLPFGIGRITRDKLLWGNDVWHREKVFY